MSKCTTGVCFHRKNCSHSTLVTLNLSAALAGAAASTQAPANSSDSIGLDGWVFIIALLRAGVMTPEIA